MTSGTLYIYIIPVCWCVSGILEFVSLNYVLVVVSGIVNCRLGTTIWAVHKLLCKL